MQSEITIPGWLRQALIGFGLFVAGAIIAFGYSYRPLHGALTWKVEHLEARLDERNLAFQKLSDELDAIRSNEAEQVDPETLAQVESELKKTKTALASLEKKHETAEQKRKDANASARTWRKRFESLQTAQRNSAPAPVPAAPAPVPVPEDFVRPAPRSVPADRANDFSAAPSSGRSPSAETDPAQADAFPEATIRRPAQSPGRTGSGMLSQDASPAAP